MLLPSILILLEAVVVSAVTYTLSCDLFPDVCDHKCYSIYVAGLPGTLTYDAPGIPVKTMRRKQVGAIPNPCCQAVAAPSSCTWNGQPVPCSSPDEYPYAASAQGGTGGLIRCTGARENSQEGSRWGAALSRGIAKGGCGGQRGCQITIAFGFVGQGSPFCTTRRGPNDGFEWSKGTGTWNLAKRDNEEVLEPHVPDPAVFFPPELRREFLLDNGHRVLLGSSDLERNWDDEVFIIGNTTARVVRELLGAEKSPPFRPDALGE